MSTSLAPRWWTPAFSGLRGVSWQTFALILAINTGFAAILYIEDTRPFWHPFITAQCFGLAIAYAVNAASPWEKTHPVWRLVLAVAAGAITGYLLVVVLKGHVLALEGYTFTELRKDSHKFEWTLFGGFFNGLLVSLFFLLKFRDVRARAQILKSEADRNLLSRQAAEAELKLMQAQIEPHFLFNTLASVQFLTETDPPRAGQMLGHLLAYLRAALPQLRSGSTTLGQEADLAQAYLSIMQMRMGARLDFAIDIPAALRAHPFPPMLLMSVVENAVKHGIEPCAEGGAVRLEAHRADDSLAVSVADSGMGLAGKIGQGVGLTNLRERLKALYGARATFALEAAGPQGARATIAIPYEPTAG
jgi:hypothetical protein